MLQRSRANSDVVRPLPRSPLPRSNSDQRFSSMPKVKPTLKCSVSMTGLAALENQSGNSKMSSEKQAEIIHDSVCNRSLIQSLNNTASDCFRSGRYTEAMENYNQACVIARKDSESSNGRTFLTVDEQVLKRIMFAYTLNCIATLHWVCGRFKKAFKVLTEALPIARYYENVGGGLRASTISKANLCVASVQTNIGNVYLHRNELNLAFKAYDDALCLQKVSLGLTHPDVARTVSSIAHVKEKMGLTDRAIDLYVLVLKVLRENTKEGEIDSLSVAATLLRLANSWHCKGDFDRSIHHFAEALAIQEHWLGRRHLGKKLGYPICLLGDYCNRILCQRYRYCFTIFLMQNV